MSNILWIFIAHSYAELKKKIKKLTLEIIHTLGNGTFYL